MPNEDHAMTDSQPTVGLLPLYVALYDELLPELRHDFADFLEDIAAGFEARGHAVHRAPICCVAGEFARAIQQFEDEGVDLIVTLHLSYSPSLEAADALCETSLPILMLDTSMDAAFGVDVSADRIMYNHGVHGVMDLASVLRRRGRAYDIVAGHYQDLPVRLGTCVTREVPPQPAAGPKGGDARAVVAARALRSTRALRVGPVFPGMGDFMVDEAVLETALGITVTQIDLNVLDEAVGAVSDNAVATELSSDHGNYDCALSVESHERATRVGLGLRHLLEDGKFTAFSVNFQAFDRADRPACTMPFLEISKAMGRGVGYAGEGDVLTAALVGALAQAFDAVTFTEIFCADWTGGSLFLSHMGEISPSVAGDTPRVFEKPMPFIGGHAPAVLTCAMKPGPAVLVNLAPGPNDRFSLIVAPVEVLSEDATLDPAMRDVIRGWVRPACAEREGDRRGVSDFLEAFSRAGGTHHSALVLGDQLEALQAFGHMCGCEVVTIAS
ncbi:MAG: L-arabinose isomerase [Rhodothermales bacterium]|jgi:L-arabinose isomerase